MNCWKCDKPLLYGEPTVSVDANAGACAAGAGNWKQCHSRCMPLATFYGQAVGDKLPSKFQLGDTVRARGVPGMVSGICFREAKVFYEVGGIMHPSDDVMEPLRVVEQ